MAQPVAALVVRVAADLSELKTGMNEVGPTLDTADKSATKLKGTFSSLRGGMNELAQGAGITFRELGLLDTAFGLVGAAMAGWKIGRFIADLTGLDDKIASVTASWLGYDKQLKEQVAGATADAVAVKQQYLLNVIAQGPKILENWHNEIAKLGPAQAQLIADIDSHAYSLEQLHDKYGISIQALKNFEHEMQEGAAEAKRTSDAEIRAVREYHQAEEEATKGLKKSLAERRDALNESMIGVVQYYQALQKARLQATNDAVVAEFTAKQSLVAGHEAETTALGRLTAALDALHAKRVAGFSQESQEAVLQNEFAKSLYEEAVAADQARDSLAGHNAELSAVPALTQAAIAGMAGYATVVNGVARDLFNRPVAGSLLNPGLARAAGGPVSAGTSYLVGERGPEMFTPGSSGHISPNGAGGVSFAQGSVVINYPIMNDPRAKDELARLVGDAVIAKLGGQGVRLPVSG